MKVTSKNIPHYKRQDDDDKLNFKSLILKYVKAWPVIIAFMAAAMVIAFLVNSFTPPVYKIQSKFLINEQGDDINLFDEEARKDDPLPKGQKIANESIIIKSRSVAAEAMAQLPFDIEYYREDLFIDTEIYRNTPIKVEVDWNHPQLTNGRIRISWTDNKYFTLELLDAEYQEFTPGARNTEPVVDPELSENSFLFGEWFQMSSIKLRVNLTATERSGSSVIKIRDTESLIQQYTGDNFQVVPADKISSILLLTLDTHQPYKGQDYLNMVMKVVLDNELDEKNTIARNTINFIDKQLEGIADSLNYSQARLETYRSRNRTYNITTEGNSLYEKLSELEIALSQEKFKSEYYRNLREYLVGEHYSEIVIPSGLGIEEPVLNKLIEDLVHYQSDKSGFLATQTENSPAVIEVNRKIRDLNISIQEAVKNVMRNTDLSIADLSKRITRIEGQFGRLPQTEQDLLNIKRTYSLNESIYTYLLQQRAEASITLAANTPSNKIIEPAVLNLVPMRLRPLLNYFLAMLLGLILPIGVMSVRESFYSKITDPKEVEGKLLVPVVGSIGKNRKQSPLVVLSHPRARISEAFRGLRTNIDFVFSSEKQLTVLISSSVAGEGKSFCSANLAAVYSACGKNTLIIGCDMHKPFLFAGFEVSNSIGLSNFLQGKVHDLSEIVQSTGHRNLDVLVPGPVPPNPADLLISDRFQHLIKNLQNFYDVIILDSSPIGLTNETIYLTRAADLTIFLLRQNYSEIAFLDEINSLKEKKGITNLFVLINDVEDRYLSYGGYGYGYYDEEPEESGLRKVIRIVSNKAAI